VIHFLENEYFGIAEIARNEESYNLVRAIRQNFISEGQAGDDNMAVG
jgi:hypothetical protein